MVALATVKLALTVGLLTTWALVDAGLARAACDSPEHAHLDFWIGEWKVVDQSGATVAETSVRSILDGCALEQIWSASDGMRARGLLFYFERTGRWHLTWIETRGMLLRLDGRRREGAFVFSGDAPGRDGGAVRHELILERLEGGRLRQTWRQSRDGGESWPVAFALFYGPGRAP